MTEETVAKKPRAPRKDYGFAPDAVITLTEKSPSYRGKRKEWYESVVAAQGCTVEAWAAGKGDEKNPPRGWLRFFVADGSVALSKAA